MSQTPTTPSGIEPVPDSRIGEGFSSGRALVLAWAISILCHVVLFAVMFLAPWLTDFVTPPDDLPIARTELLGEMTEGRLSPAPEPTLVDQSQAADPDAMQLKPKRFEELSRPVSAARPDLAIIGIGTGGGEDFSKYGLRADSGPGPSFFGLGRQARGARRIVYVVDRSGSMLTTFDAVRREMRDSVGDLRRSQYFHVIFFNSGPALENRPKRLVPATAGQKQQLFGFLDEIRAEGSTDPIPAMERAFAVKPDLIYFLTDGDFDPALLERLREWNRNKKVRIFTIAYVSEAGRVLLEQIARENNGEFRFVSEFDIL